MIDIGRLRLAVIGALCSVLLMTGFGLEETALAKGASSHDVPPSASSTSVGKHGVDQSTLDQMSRRIDDFRIAHEETEERINSTTESFFHILIAFFGISLGGLFWVHKIFQNETKQRIEMALGAEYIKNWNEFQPIFNEIIESNGRLSLLNSIKDDISASFVKELKSAKKWADVKDIYAKSALYGEVCAKLCSDRRAFVEEALSIIETGNISDFVAFVPSLPSALGAVGELQKRVNPEVAVRIGKLKLNFASGSE